MNHYQFVVYLVIFFVVTCKYKMQYYPCRRVTFRRMKISQQNQQIPRFILKPICCIYTSVCISILLNFFYINVNLIKALFFSLSSNVLIYKFISVSNRFRCFFTRDVLFCFKKTLKCENFIIQLVLGLQYLTPLSTTVSINGGGNQSTQRKPLTCHKLLIILSSTPCLNRIRTHNFSGDRH